jgi:hypothetical protein
MKMLIIIPTCADTGSRNLFDKKHPLYYNSCEKMHAL